MATLDPTLTIVRAQSDHLIRAEITAQNQRTMLERAVCDAINKLGKDINDVSDASGLTPDEINQLLDSGPTLEDELYALAGVA